MTRSLILLPFLFVLSVGESRAEAGGLEAPTSNTSCSKSSDDGEATSVSAAPAAPKSGSSAAPIRSAAPSRAVTPRWNSLLPGMFR